jgi:carbonic anhydrase/acetyltransferase-like protein (isoleucine patch superfamily)
VFYAFIKKGHTIACIISLKESFMAQPINSFKGISPTLGKNVYVDGSARIVGDVVLEDDASIWPMVAARGDVNKIRIGARSNIQDGSVLHVTRKSEKNPDGFPLIIGEDVTVGHKCMLHGCQLGNRILVGMGAIVMDGVVESVRKKAYGTVRQPNEIDGLQALRPMMERV